VVGNREGLRGLSGLGTEENCVIISCKICTFNEVWFGS